MPIVASVVIWDQPQTDGRRYVREQHADHLGVIQFRDYLVAAGVVVADGFPAVVAILNQQLIDAEIAKDLAAIYADGPLAVGTIDYVTLANIRAALREAYRTVTREQTFALGAFLNTLTNAQLGTLFGVSGSQLTQLRTRLQTKATQWAEYLAAGGE